MSSDLYAALEYLAKHPGPSRWKAHLEACEVLLRLREELPYRMLFFPPVRMFDIRNDRWLKVMAASSTISPQHAGRFILPSFRSDFQAGEELVTLHLGDVIFVKPAGSPFTSAYASIRVIRGDSTAFDLRIVSAPYARQQNEPPLPTSEISFAHLASANRSAGEEPYIDCLITIDETVIRVPLLKVRHLDARTGNITCILDAGVEVFRAIDAQR